MRTIKHDSHIKQAQKKAKYNYAKLERFAESIWNDDYLWKMYEVDDSYKEVLQFFKDVHGMEHHEYYGL